MNRILSICCLIWLCCTGCSTGSETQVGREPRITPDYAGTVIPCNIAPLRFRVLEEGSRYRAVFRAGSVRFTCRSGRGGICMSKRRWRRLMQAGRGDGYTVEISVYRHGAWQCYEPVRNAISNDPIDRYLTYRIIEPGYMSYGDMYLVQRDLTGFGMRTLVSNRRDVAGDSDGCINCHTPHNQHGDRTAFHVRGPMGGTVITTPDGAVKLNMKTDSTFSATVYPAWHPSGKRIAFSINSTGQLFHSLADQKVEVFDTRSDLVLFDLETGVLSGICRTDSVMETFPAWSPDGRWLYYCSAVMPPADSTETLIMDHVYEDIHYNLMRKPYDDTTGAFGPEETVVKASTSGLSVSFPRISPDGRFLVFCLAEYGTFSIWHRSTNLFIIDFQTGELRPMAQVNSSDTESYHAWSSSGRWMVVSSRRDDGNYTRPYLVHIDADGQDSKPFVLPQRRPEAYDNLLKSFNVPEFMTTPALHGWRYYSDIIHSEAKQIEYK